MRHEFQEMLPAWIFPTQVIILVLSQIKDLVFFLNKVISCVC